MMKPNDNANANENKVVEIILGNKNVAEAGSMQLNITQNNFTPEALEKVLEKVVPSWSREQSSEQGSNSSKEKVPQSSTVSPHPSKRKPGRKPKDKRERDIEDVFTYKWLNERSGQVRIIRLYQYLKHTSVGWLDPDASVEDWCALFMGEPKPFKLKWTGTQQHLKHLFRLLLEREYISRTNTSVGPWEIVGSHFLDKNRRPFSDWDSQHPAKRKKDVLSWLAEFLNVSADLPKEITDEEFIEDEFSEFADHERNNPRKPKFVNIDDIVRDEWKDDEY